MKTLETTQLHNPSIERSKQDFDAIVKSIGIMPTVAQVEFEESRILVADFSDNSMIAPGQRLSGASTDYAADMYGADRRAAMLARHQ